MSTSTQEKTGPSATVDLAGLKRFLEERKLGDTRALRSENISFGHSNERFCFGIKDGIKRAARNGKILVWQRIIAGFDPSRPSQASKY